MSYWSVYVSKEDEKALKKPIEQLAEKKRWSFSQAVIGLLREHLLEERANITDAENWQKLTAQSFFEGYPEQDSIYDKL